MKRAVIAASLAHARAPRPLLICAGPGPCAPPSALWEPKGECGESARAPGAHADTRETEGVACAISGSRVDLKSYSGKRRSRLWLDWGESLQDVGEGARPSPARSPIGLEAGPNLSAESSDVDDLPLSRRRPWPRSLFCASPSSFRRGSSRDFQNWLHGKDQRLESGRSSESELRRSIFGRTSA